MRIDYLEKQFKKGEITVAEPPKDDVCKNVSTGSLKFDAITDGGLSPGVIRFMGCFEGGKAQPLDEPVLTPNGFKEIGSLKVGDEVFTKNGTITTVTGVFPQGRKEVYKVIFSDGTSTRCCLDHLWETYEYADSRTENYKKVVPLRYILKTLKTYWRNHKQFNHYIDYCQPIQFPKKNLSIHPYVMGCLLGDGSFRNKYTIKFTSKDLFIVNKINLFSSSKLNKSGEIEYYFPNGDLLPNIKEYGLHLKYSYEKFIPRDYLLSSVEDRIHLLHGLMDTEGNSKQNRSQWEFTTTSKLLSDDFVFLVRSLGGRAVTTQRVTSYTHNDEKRLGKPSYRTRISFSNNLVPASLPRKVNNSITKKNTDKKTIVAVEPHATRDCVCISVDSSDGLYITNNFIVTHNTKCSLECAENFLDAYQEKGRVLFLKVEMRLSYDMQSRSRRPFLVMKPGTELECLQNWSHENILVYTQNVFPEISKFLYGVLKSLEPGEKLFVILDSVDWLKLGNDVEDFLEQRSNQPADVAKYMKQFLKTIGPMFTENGHFFLFISQVSSKIKINKYEGNDQKETVAVGGNALLHASDWIFQFKPKSEIKEKDGPAHETENPILGYNIKIKIHKSPNETTGYTFEYPVKIGASVWKEKELVDALRDFEIIEKAGAWYAFPEKTVEIVKNKFGIDLPAKVQGEKKLMEVFETNPALTDYFFKSLQKALSIGRLSKHSILSQFFEDEDDE